MLKPASPFILLIRLYQKTLSPLMGNQCRFYPTCSAYGIEALERHGAFKGLIMTIWRLLRCQPFSKGPWTDPVPEKASFIRFARGLRFRYKRRNHGCGGICNHKDVT